jgi:glycosyltransferase involved in cell wall biosynthesis
VIRVLQFAGVINRYDFIDTIVQHADPGAFQIGVCVGSAQNNIADPVYSAHTPRWVIGSVSRLTLLQRAWRLAHVLREWEADILHTHHYNEAVIGWLATRMYPKTRLIVGRHYSDALYRLTSGIKRRVFLEVEQLVNRAATRIIVPATYIFRLLTERQGIRTDKIDLISYGFEPAKYTLPSSTEIGHVREELALDGRFALGTFARLHEEKGHRYLLRAIARLKSRLPDVLLLIVGEGPERAGIERQIREDCLDQHVRLTGWRRDAMTIMAAVDAVVHPSLHEAFSQAMVEALWMRKPLVITDVSGAPDIIRDGHNGMLVPRGDATALAAAIERLAGDPGLRSRLGDAGRKYVEENLVIGKIIPKYEQSYIKAMGKELGA